MSIADRARIALNLKSFSDKHKVPEGVETLRLYPPGGTLRVLRMLIREPHGKVHLPYGLEWVSAMVVATEIHQQKLGIKQPFVYLTVRSGVVETKTDDQWHIDGFSMNHTHLPEQNYVWCSNNGTEFVDKAWDFPEDYDPLKYNLNSFFHNRINPAKDNVYHIPNEQVYLMDPYIVHRRPPTTFGNKRTFVRITHCPMPIVDVNNTKNPFIPTHYKRDGVKDFRNNLLCYDKEKEKEFSRALVAAGKTKDDSEESRGQEENNTSQTKTS